MIEAWFDGACWPNPNGVMSCGIVIKLDNQSIFEQGYKYEKTNPEEKTSNNKAEYFGLLKILKYLMEHNYHKEKIIIRGDSKLVINQMSGSSQIGDGIYLEFAQAASIAKAPFTDLRFIWIPREENSEADAYAEKVLLDAGHKKPFYFKKEKNHGI